jgi:hypothetical protein
MFDPSLLHHQRVFYDSKDGSHLSGWIPKSRTSHSTVLHFNHREWIARRTQHKSDDDTPFGAQALAMSYVQPNDDFKNSPVLYLPHTLFVLDISNDFEAKSPVHVERAWPAHLLTLRLPFSVFNNLTTLPPQLNNLIIRGDSNQRASIDSIRRSKVFPVIYKFLIVDVHGDMNFALPSQTRSFLTGSGAQPDRILVWRANHVSGLDGNEWNSASVLSYGPDAAISLPSGMIPNLPRSLRYLELPKNFAGLIEASALPRTLQMIDIGCGYIEHSDYEQLPIALDIMHVTCRPGENCMAVIPDTVSRAVVRFRDIDVHTEQHESISKRRRAKNVAYFTTPQGMAVFSTGGRGLRALVIDAMSKEGEVHISDLPPGLELFKLTSHALHRSVMKISTTWPARLRSVWCTHQDVVELLANAISLSARVPLVFLGGPSTSVLVPLLERTSVSRLAVDVYDFSGNAANWSVDRVDVLQGFANVPGPASFPPNCTAINTSAKVTGRAIIPRGTSVGRGIDLNGLLNYADDAECTKVLRGTPLPYSVS